MMSDRTLAFTKILLTINILCPNPLLAQDTIPDYVQRRYLEAAAISTQNLDSVHKIANHIYELSQERNYEYGKIKGKIKASYIYMNKLKLDTALVLADECLLFFDQNKAYTNTIDHGAALFYKSVVLFRKRELENSIRFAKLSLDIYQKLNNKVNEAKVIAHFGLIEDMKDNLKEALKYYLEAYRINSEINKGGEFLFDDINRISNIYRRIGLAEKALEYDRINVNTMLGANNLRKLSIAYESLGTTYQVSGQLDSALHYYLLSKEKAIEAGSKSMAIVRNSAISKTLTYLGRYSESNNMIHEYLNNSKHSYAAYSMDLYNTLAQNHFHLQNIDSSIYYAKKAYAYSSQYNRDRLSTSLTILISEGYERKKIPDSALFYLKAHLALKDSIYNDDTQKKLSELYAQIETNEKQNEIELLDKEKAIMYAQKQKLQATLIFGSLTAALTILSLIISYKYRQKKQTLINIELERELNQKKTDLHLQALRMIQINNGLSEVEGSLKKIKEETPGNQQDVNRVLKNLNLNKSLNKEWNDFEKYFGNAHEGFYEKISKKFPNLTIADKRLAALIKMNMNNREIASIMNIENNSVKMAKYRLKKKMNIDETIDVNQFLQTFA